MPQLSRPHRRRPKRRALLARRLREGAPQTWASQVVEHVEERIAAQAARRKAKGEAEADVEAMKKAKLATGEDQAQGRAALLWSRLL